MVAFEAGGVTGLLRRPPVVAGVYTLILFSLAGIPLTAGFLGKFYIVAAGASVARWTLLFVLVVTSAIGLSSAGSRAGNASIWALRALTVLVVWIGCCPAPVLQLIRTMIAA